MAKSKQEFKVKRKIRVKKYGEGKDPEVDLPDEVVEFPEEVVLPHLPPQAKPTFNK